ncbi:hypothetical protein D9758_006477 [Tetrapyrgos nigripes]|uniref:Uncharacterized protein n=1 Tax=Tetrapyrgos nigripes TaxID=182062 RepID=A0A8H5GL96_9AGAR|nr:hypothetical protein D9758_006477 [Tetrapyrgos nigripes]
MAQAMDQPVPSTSHQSDLYAPSTKSSSRKLPIRRKANHKVTDTIQMTQDLLRKYSRYAVVLPELEETRKNFQDQFDFLCHELSGRMFVDILPKGRILKKLFWRSEPEDLLIKDLCTRLSKLQGRLFFASGEVEFKHRSKAHAVSVAFREELDRVLLQRYASKAEPTNDDARICRQSSIPSNKRAESEVRPKVKMVYDAEQEEIAYMVHICDKLQTWTLSKDQTQQSSTGFDGVSPGLLILPATNTTSSNPQQLTGVNAATGSEAASLVTLSDPTTPTQVSFGDPLTRVSTMGSVRSETILMTREWLSEGRSLSGAAGSRI